MNDTDLDYHSTDESKLTRHVAEVAKGMMALSHGPIVTEDIDVVFWRYRYYGDLPYVANLITIPEVQLNGWCGKYMVHPDATCWARAIFPAHLRYIVQEKSPFGHSRLVVNSVLCRRSVGS